MEGIGRCEISMRVYERVKIKDADEGEGEDTWTGKVMHGQFVR